MNFLGRSLVIAFLASLSISSQSIAQADTTSTNPLLKPALSETLEESMLIKGTISQQLNDHDVAIQMFLLGLEKNPSSTSLLLGLSESYLSLEDFKSSLFYIEKALELDQRNSILFAQKMNIYSSQKDTDKLRELIAFAETEKISSQDIDDFRHLMKEGLASNANSQDDSEKLGDSFIMILDRINDLASIPKVENGDQSIDGLIDQSELDNAKKDYLKGRLAYSEKKFPEALSLFERSISEDPKNVSSWAFLIKAASNSGDLSKASNFADQADLLFPYQKEIELANIHRLIASNDLEEATMKLQTIEVGANWESEKSMLAAKLKHKQQAQ